MKYGIIHLMKTKYFNSADTKWARLRSLTMVGAMTALLAGAAGCASVYTTSPGSFASMEYQGANSAPTEIVSITTTGYHFRWSIPLVSGDLRWNEATRSINGGTCLFSDQVGADELQNALLKIAERRNCDVIDIVFDDSDTSYAGVSESGAIGLFFGSSHMGVSGVLVPKKAQPESQEVSETQKGGAK